MLLAILVGGVTGFTSQHHHRGVLRTCGAAAKTSDSQLMMSSSFQSRRDILAGVTAVGLSALVLGPSDAMAFKPGPITAQSAANKAAESYQGVYYDPQHPQGYRVIRQASGSKGSKGNGATSMTFSDGVAKKNAKDKAATVTDGSTEEKTYNDIPVATKEGSNELVFDFSFKGGPKKVVGTLSGDKQSIAFPDGNTWNKNANRYDGIYKDPKYPKGYRIIRQSKSMNTITEINDTGNPKDSKFLTGKHGSLFSIPTAPFTFYGFTGNEICAEKLCRSCDAICKDEVVAQFSLQESNAVFPYGTITFPDKTIWTRI